MEGTCALLIPPVAFANTWPGDAPEAGALALSVTACSAMLVVGTLYWRAALRRSEGDPAPMERALAIADRLQRFLAVLSFVSVGPALVLLAQRGMRPAVAMALGLSILAVLEYLNYYHRQLQNFDHAADFRRLLRDRRLRRAHMARDLAAWRARRRGRSA